MSFSHLCETFRSPKIEHDDIQPEQTSMLKDFTKLSINAIEDKEVRGEDI